MVVVALDVVVAMVVVEAYVDETGGFLTPLVALHMQIAILKLKLANILKNISCSCLHTRNIKFRR